ncbi:MAG TPA: glycogen/starch synthase [Dissulfurispiraceae bacterium]|nr:glycogen/starch synthase [Dissulfurispiraceae bacterium]
MRIAVVTSEAIPFSKTGGLADVAGTLFKEYLAMKHEARLFVPFYKRTAEQFSGLISDSRIEIDIPMGHAARSCKIFTGIMRDQAPNIYFIGNEDFFFRDELYGTSAGDYPDNDQRFVFFSKSVLEICKKLDLQIDIMHCNDWQTGLIPLYMKTLYRQVPIFKKTASVFTIHNLGYQGLFPPHTLEVTGLGASMFNPEGIEFFGKVNFLKAGIIGADRITTVSKTYAEEIRSHEYGFGLEGLLTKRSSVISGILNGIDYTEWDPLNDAFLADNYDRSDLSGKQACKKQLINKTSLKRTGPGPLICFIGRLSSQKGIDLLADAIPYILGQGANMVVIGKGDGSYQAMLQAVSRRFSDSFFFCREFDESLAHLAYAGSDVFLMPSRYEPCGLGQMIAMRYGTLPVARKTGGLSDTIEDGKTGFLFGEYSLTAFINAVRRAVKAFDDKKAWRKMISNAMEKDFSWGKSAQAYIEIYQNALKTNG